MFTYILYKLCGVVHVQIGVIVVVSKIGCLKHNDMAMDNSSKQTQGHATLNN